MSMDNGPDWVILLMYWSHDMRHAGFRKLTVVNGTPGIGASQHGIRAMMSNFFFDSFEADFGLSSG